MKTKIILLICVCFIGCTKVETNVPENRKLNYECTWTHNAYYVLKSNGKVVVSSLDSLNTTLMRIQDFPYKQGDFVELIIQSLDSLGSPDNSTIHGAIVIDGYKSSTNTTTGYLYLYH